MISVTWIIFTVILTANSSCSCNESRISWRQIFNQYFASRQLFPFLDQLSLYRLSLTSKDLQGCVVTAVPDILLLEAARAGNLNFLKRLLIRNDINFDRIKDAAFLAAVENGHLSIVECLVQSGVNIHNRNNSALMKAASTGNLPIVDYLVRRGANIRAANGLSLIYACLNGHLETVRYLLARGADADVRNFEALMNAISSSDLELFKVLYQYSNRLVSSPSLIIEVINESRLEILKYILEVGLDPEQKDDILFGALRLALVSRKTEILHCLVAHGADFRAQSESALRWAVRTGYTAAVHCFIRNGADIAVLDNEALASAIQAGHLKIVKLLVEAGADVHARNGTLIDLARMYGHYDILDYLIAHRN